MKKLIFTAIVILFVGVSGILLYEKFFDEAAMINKTLEQSPASAGAGAAPDLFDNYGIKQSVRKTLPKKAIPGRNRSVNVHTDLLELDTLTLNLFDDVIVTAVRDRLIDNVQGSTTWIGHVEGEPESEVFLTVRGKTVSGNVQIGENTYEIEPKGNNLHDITQVDPSKNPEHSRSRKPEEFPSAAGEISTSPTAEASLADATSAGTVIDLLVAYTPKAKTNASGQTGIEAKIINSVAMANQAYINSKIDIQINLVAMEEINYVETGDMLTSLTDLTGTNDGKMDDVHNLRNQYGADQVALISADTSYCGIGYMMTSAWRNSAFAAYAFSVAHDDSSFACLSNNTLAHELGHNQGDQHNLENTPDGPGSYDYSYGYRLCQTGGFRTVMSYSCSGGTRISYFSNPDISLTTGESTGTSEANNALSMTNNKAIVAAFRATVTTSSAPSAPSNLNATAVSSSQVDLLWTDNSGDETGFRLERSGDGVNWSEIAVTGSNVVNFTDSGLIAATAYQYRLRAYNSSGYSSYSNIGTTTTNAQICVNNSPALGMSPGSQYGKPGAAISLAISLSNKDTSSCSASTFALNSSDGADLGSYDLNPADATSTTWSLPAPATDGTYTKSVTASATGHSNATVSATVIVDGTPPSAPANLSTSIVKKTTVRLSWDASTDSGSGFDHYEIIRNDTKIGTTTLTEFSDKPGGRKVTYTYTVQAFDRAGNSISSSKSVVM